jgi:hypothetical protein
LNSHGPAAGGLYNEGVNRFRKLPLIAVAALLAAFFAAACARADTGTNVSVPVDNPPVVRIQMRSGNLTIRTWDRPEVEVASSDTVVTKQFGPTAVERALRGGDIPIFSTKVFAHDGQISLPQEDFAVPSLSGAPHDGVIIFGGDTGATITVTVPNSTALLWTMVGHGRLRIQDYHGGAFVARVHNGLVSLGNVSGDGYVEAARGAIAIENSAFNRIRARTAVGNILFANCNARQIEVSSINGSIAYDNGTFVPGLARFETQDGDVALGIAGGGVQVGAHTANGRIFSNFAHGADVRGSATDAQATVNGGGPVVTASSQRGSVYLYDGAFKSRPVLRRQWRPVGRMFRAKTCGARPCRV